MERLTIRNSTGPGYIGRYTQLPGLETASTMRVAAIRDVMQRLAEYEDTGLEPAEIVAMLKEHKRIQERGGQPVHSRWLYVGMSNGKRIFSCQNCENLVAGAGDYCKVCGAKMDLPQISQRTAEALEEIGRQAHQEAGNV